MMRLTAGLRRAARGPRDAPARIDQWREVDYLGRQPLVVFAARQAPCAQVKIGIRGGREQLIDFEIEYVFHRIDPPQPVQFGAIQNESPTQPMQDHQQVLLGRIAQTAVELDDSMQSLQDAPPDWPRAADHAGDGLAATLDLAHRRGSRIVDAMRAVDARSSVVPTLKELR